LRRQRLGDDVGSAGVGGRGQDHCRAVRDFFAECR